MAFPTTSWTINGLAVEVEPAQLTADLNGYDAASGTLPEEQARAVGADQGAILKVWTDTGRPAWEGRLVLDPTYRDGTASITAAGYRVEASHRKDRLLFQTRDYSYWQPTDDDADEDEVIVESNMIHQMGANTNASGTRVFAGSATAYFEGVMGISRVAATIVTNPDVSAVHWYVYGVRVDGAADDLIDDNTTTGAIDVSFDNPGDYSGVTLTWTFTVAEHGHGRLRIRNLRVNGVGTSDTYTSSDVVGHIGSLLGFDTTEVQATGTSVLPLDVPFGTSWQATLDYMAAIEDWTWRVLDDPGDGPRLLFGPWERVWAVKLEENAEAELAPLPRKNRAIVYWSQDGTPRNVEVVSDPDPLEKYGLVRTEEMTLSDPMADQTLADAVAAILADRVSQVRYAGRMSIVDARRPDGSGTAYEVLPGDLVRVDDWGPSDAVTLRIHEVQRGATRVTLGIESPASAASLLNKALLGLKGAMKDYKPFYRHSKVLRQFLRAR